ncbi:hypothetical protein ACIBQ1_09480 [Nonomuraea sp. NPDC050153]|uniref:hypothetical protein n=1 Tax=Nonomuraea sp. NPDC050153 TaxID=3364359 RepID=UPI003790F9CC
MTGDWVPLHVAVKRIREATGRHPKVADIHRLGDEDELIVEWLHDHYGVLESSLAAYLNDLAAHGGDDQTAGPTVGGGPELPLEIEADYQRRKDEP